MGIDELLNLRLALDGVSAVMSSLDRVERAVEATQDAVEASSRATVASSKAAESALEAKADACDQAAAAADRMRKQDAAAAREAERLARANEDAARAARRAEDASATIGASLLAGGFGVAVTALRAYDDAARARMGIQSLLGDSAGARLSDSVEEFALPSAYDARDLRKMAQQFAAVNMAEKDILPTIRAVTDLAAAGGVAGAELNNVTRALAQIRSKGVVQAEEIRGQLGDAAPVIVAKVEQALGMKSGQLASSGISADRFFDGLRKAQGLPGIHGAQDRLARISPMIQVANTAQALLDSLRPTGELFGKILTPLTDFITSLTKLFSQVNRLTGGFLGLLIVSSLVFTAFRISWPWIMRNVRSFAALNVQLGIATNLFEAINARLTPINAAGGAGAAAAAGGAGSGSSAAAAGAGAAAAGGAAAVSGWRRVGIAIGRIQAILTLTWLPRLLAFGKALAIVAGAIAAVLAIVEVIERLSGVPARDRMSAKVGDWLGRAWAQKTLSPKDDAGRAVPAAERPQRRSSWENVMDRRYAQSWGG